MNHRTDRHRPIANRLRTVVAAAGLLLLYPACVVPAPPIETLHDRGLVRAEDRFHADMYAGMVAEIQPLVAELLPGTLDRQTEVWVQSQLSHGLGKVAPDNVKGFTLIDAEMNRGRIHVRSDNDFPRWFLTHELVHALLGPEWLTLSGVLEEGMCDLVAAELNPDCAPRIRALRAIESSIFFGKMKVVVEHKDGTGTERKDAVWFHYDRGSNDLTIAQALEPGTLALKRRFERVPDTLYGLGFLVAERIRERGGFEAIYELCAEATAEGRATVPVERIIEAAGLNGSRERLATLSHELLGADEFEHWVELLPDFHGDLLAQLFQDAHRDLSAEQFIERLDPVFVLHDGTRIVVADHPHIRQTLERAWRHAAHASK
jgi:hypothetical protein